MENLYQYDGWERERKNCEIAKKPYSRYTHVLDIEWEEEGNKRKEKLNDRNNNIERKEGFRF